MRTSRSDDTKWEKQHTQLKQYVKKHGHSKVPSSLHNELSEWVKQQRSERKKGTLSEERIGQLDLLNFWWGKEKKPKKATTVDNFDEMHQQLQAFYKEKGHTRAPLTSNLGVWCQKQRTKFRDNTISPQHRARLEEIGFDYYQVQSNNKRGTSSKTPTENWDGPCRQVEAFYQDHGHFVIPKQQRHADLHTWVASQRKAYKDGRLKKQRREKLDAIHFIWTEAAAVESQKTWDRNYDKLKRFKQRKGHSFVQRNDDIQLWRWTEKNDWKQRRGTLPRKQYERLASIGFWDPPPDNLSERGETTNQGDSDIAFVVGGEDGENANNDRACKQGGSDEGPKDESDEEEEADDNYDEREAEDDDSSDDDNLEEQDDEEEDDSGRKPRAKRTRSKVKGKKEDERKPRARKRLRRASTFDDEGFSTRYQVGTKVMKYFDEHGWFQGEIISIYEQNVYKIRYEDDDEETYQIPDEQEGLDQIVANADILRHEIGTNVKKLFEGHGWFEGKVIAREQDRYKIRYEDGDKEDYLFDSELKELDELVANARSQ